MSLASDLQKLAKVAFDVTESVPMSLIPLGTYAVGKGRGPDGTPIKCQGHLTRFSSREIDGSRILWSDMKAVFQPINPSEVIDTLRKYRLEADGGQWQVNELRPKNLGATAIAYDAAVRRLEP